MKVIYWYLPSIIRQLLVQKMICHCGNFAQSIMSFTEWHLMYMMLCMICTIYKSIVITMICKKYEPHQQQLQFLLCFHLFPIVEGVVFSKLQYHYSKDYFVINSLRPSHAIWQQGSRSKLVQVMAWCLMAPSHYLNQCRLIISEVIRHSPGRNSMRDVLTINR